MNKEQLFKVPVPMSTSTYKPISHKNIYEQTKSLLDKSGIEVANEYFQTNGKGTQLITTMDIKYPGIEEMGMRLAFRNSYDKTMSVGYVAGANVWICGNGMVSGELKFTRKHTGTVVSDLELTIEETIEQLEENFLKLVRHSKQMKEIELSKRAVSSLVGRFYLEEDLVTSTQLNVIKRQLEEPAYDEFSDPTLWSLYNHATFAFKEATPMNYIKQHAKLHDFIETEFELT
jgi:hypothetical protein